MFPIFQEAKAAGQSMGEGLGRSVVARHRFARLWALGDRKNPVAHTPALVLLDGDFEVEATLAPFRSMSTTDIPSMLTLESRLPLSPPGFEHPSPTYTVSVGHVLPPSLEEADAGEPAGTAQLLPVSWQRLNHDDALTNPDLLPDVVVLVDALQLAAQPGRLVEAITVLKQRFPGALLWTPGLGGPDNVALLTWFGVDLFDLSRSRQAAAAGVLLTAQGPRHGVPTMGESTSMEEQVKHWRMAISEVRAAMATDQMRSLVDRQSLNSARSVEHLRRHDLHCSKIPGLLTSHVDRTHSFPCHSASVQTDPLITDWESFISETYTAPVGLDTILVLLPCSARKPYRLSKSHGRFIRAIGTSACHEVMVTSPLGLVPRDLEEVWPAAHYDVPVTGDWTGDEMARIERMFQRFVDRHQYKRIINHSGMELTHPSVPIIETRQGDGAGGHDALERLSAAVRDAVDEFSARGRKNERMLLDTFSSVARKNMNNDAWVEGLKVRGKPPRFRLEKEGTQVALWSIDRGGFSLSKSVVTLLANTNALPVVHLKSDVVWKGDIFGAIVDRFDASIRCGADLLVYQDGKVMGLARAHAPGWEWPTTPGRLAKSHQRL
jgi:archaeosine synthase